MNSRTLAAVLVAIAVLPVGQARAGTMLGGKETVTTPFDKGRLELQIGVGGFTSFQNSDRERPQIDDIGGTLLGAWMLSDPAGSGWSRGNYEFGLRLFGSGVVTGPGSLIAGGTLVLRRNFIQPGARWVPYAQIEAGGLYNDIHRDPTQRAIGQAFEFQIGAGFGLRWLVDERWAIFAEANYRHISNANLASRNHGTNAIGGYVGASLFY
jgi:lipid A 3-O-deacylase